MKKIYEQPALECLRISAENVMNNTGLEGGKPDIVSTPDFDKE